MKNYLILIVLMMLFASCSNELTIKLVDSNTKISVSDYDKVYLVKDTITLYYSTTGKYSISDNPFDNSDYGRYIKGVVIKKN